jgi:lysophospholipase L1-like esterase
MRNYLSAILILLFVYPAKAQTEHAFWKDVEVIKKYDKLYKPPLHPVLFVGSSSIRKWDDVQYVFAKYHALNRGIGGAVIDDITFYLNDLVFTYQPRQIVIYVGENDVVNERETADTILIKTIRLLQAIRAKLPDVPIAYISMKPSPCRDKFVQKAVQANLLIKNYLATQKNTMYINIFPQMLKDGKSRPELFVSDMLHMNADGYAIWNKAVKPYLLKE